MVSPEPIVGQARIEKLVVAGLRGFCAGVVRAIDVVERALEVCDGPVYVRKEIIHNRYVVEDLRRKERSSWTRSTRFRKGAGSSIPRMESRRRSGPRLAGGASGRSTRPVRS